MSSYLTDPKQAFVPTELYTPNFDAIGGMLRQRQQQYDQGFNQVKSVYNSVLNSEVTKLVNINDKSNFIKTAQDSLKNLSSADLSLPQNVAKADQIFQPFFDSKTNQDMITDMMWTKQNNNEIQRGLSLRDSKDPEERKQYFGQSIQVLQDQKEKVRNAAKGDMSVYDNKKYIPYKDPTEYLNKQQKDQGLSIEYQEGTGTPQIVSYTNGVRSANDYKKWAQQQLATPEFQDIFNTMGEYDMNYQVKHIKAMNPEISDQDVQAQVAKDYVSHIKQNYQKNIKESTNNINELKDFQDKLLSKGNGKCISPEDKKRFIDAQQQIDANDNNIKKLQNELPNWEPGKGEYQQTFDDIKTFGARFFGNKYSELFADNWGNTFAATHQATKISENKTWATQIQNDFQYAQLRQQAAEFNRKDAEGFFLKNGKGAGNAGSTRADGSIIMLGDADFNTDGIPDIREGLTDGHGKVSSGDNKRAFNQSQYSAERVGASSTDLEHIKEPADYFAGILKTSHDVAVDLRADAVVKQLRGLNIKFSDGSTLLGADALGFGNLFKDMFNNGAVHRDDQYNKIFEHFKSLGYKLVDGSPSTLLNAINSEAQKQLDKFKDVSGYLSPDLEQGIGEYITGTEQYDKWNKLQTQYSQTLSKTLNIPANSNIAVKDDNGLRLVNENDLAKEFKEFIPHLYPVNSFNNVAKKLELYKSNNNTLKNLPIPTANEIAKEYLNGNLKISTHVTNDYSQFAPPNQAHIILNGIDYGVSPEMVPSLKKLTTKYNSPEDLHKKIQDVGKSAMADLGTQYIKDGKMGQTLRYTMGDKPEENKPFAYSLLNDISNPDNYTGTNLDEPGSTIPRFLTTIATTHPEIVKMIDHLTVTDKGVPGLRLHIDDQALREKGKDSKPLYESLGLNENDVNKIRDNDLTIYVNPNTRQGGAIERLIHPKDNFIYQNILDGEVGKSSSIEESAGFKYTITPDNYKIPGKKATFVQIDLNVNTVGEYNPVTQRVDNPGKWTTDFKPVNGGQFQNGRCIIPVDGTDGHSIDDVVKMMRELFGRHLNTNNTLIKNYLASQQTSNSNNGGYVPQTREQLISEYNLRK